jgi:hypothetical protein
MKTQDTAEPPQYPVHVAAPVLAALLFLLWSSPAGAEEVKTNSAPIAGSSAEEHTPSSSSSNSHAVAEIVKMADAGVSEKVITAYIENSGASYQLTHEDVITLKNHNVHDDVLVLMLKRSAQSRAAAADAKKEALARALASRTASAGGLDPESYDYFRYHYLQPRAVESVYQRLGPYYYYYPPFPYAYGGR